MYAVIETGGKQYRISKNDILEIEKLDIQPGDSVTLDKVLLYVNRKNVEVGRPYLENVKVICEVLGNFKGKKTVSYKYRRRKSSRKKIGHRQLFTRLKVKEISIS